MSDRSWHWLWISLGSREHDTNRYFGTPWRMVSFARIVVRVAGILTFPGRSPVPPQSRVDSKVRWVPLEKIPCSAILWG